MKGNFIKLLYAEPVQLAPDARLGLALAATLLDSYPQWRGPLIAHRTVPPTLTPCPSHHHAWPIDCIRFYDARTAPPHHGLLHDGHTG